MDYQYSTMVLTTLHMGEGVKDVLDSIEYIVMQEIHTHLCKFGVRCNPYITLIPTPDAKESQVQHAATTHRNSERTWVTANYSYSSEKSPRTFKEKFQDQIQNLDETLEKLLQKAKTGNKEHQKILKGIHYCLTEVFSEVKEKMLISKGNTETLETSRFSVLIVILLRVAQRTHHNATLLHFSYKQVYVCETFDLFFYQIPKLTCHGTATYLQILDLQN